ncbi:MAG: class I adenylate-forming enzyme family protein [Pseudomonadota bacterium]
MRTLAESLAGSARLLGDRPFIIADGETLSYAAFDRRAARLANVFAGLGAAPGDVIGLYLPSVPALAAGYYACQKLGAVAAPISSMNRERELEAAVGRTGMRILLTSAETLPYAQAVQAKLGAPAAILLTDGVGDGAQDVRPLMHAAPDAFEIHPGGAEDPAALFFTSGTTGAPKGALQTQGSLYATLKDMAVHGRFLWAKETFMCALPIFNNFGATCLLNGAVFSGATLILRERWDTQQVLADITERRATYIAGSPTMFLYLLREFDPARHDLSSIRLGVTGGAPVAPNIVEQFQATLGAPLVEVYGATEVSGYVTGEPAVGVRKRGSAGLPIGGSRIEIVTDDREALPPGEVGEIRISGDVVGGGYWDDAETTAANFTPEGWLSGDLGYLDDDGYLFVVDRKKDVIISGGYNIYPLEVEDLLYTHEDVRVCAVIGLPDADKGEIPVAVVIGHAGRLLDGKGIIEFCRRRVSAYKAPRRVFTVEDMPLGPSGKILKRTLRDWARDGRLQEVS